jgi:hypothetical protein
MNPTPGAQSPENAVDPEVAARAGWGNDMMVHLYLFRDRWL